MSGGRKKQTSAEQNYQEMYKVRKRVMHDERKQTLAKRRQMAQAEQNPEVIPPSANPSTQAAPQHTDALKESIATPTAYHQPPNAMTGPLPSIEELVRSLGWAIPDTTMSGPLPSIEELVKSLGWAIPDTTQTNYQPANPYGQSTVFLSAMGQNQGLVTGNGMESQYPAPSS